MKKGPLFEKNGVEYLNASFDTNSIERRVMGGTKDRGDVSGVFFQGQPFVVEFKNVKTLRPKQYFAELETECGNADTDLGAIVFHRDGFGEKHMGKQGVLMTRETLARLLCGRSFVTKTVDVKRFQPKKYLAVLEGDPALNAIVFLSKEQEGAQGVLLTYETLVKLLGGNPPKED